MTRIQKQAPPRGRLAAFVTAVQVGVGVMVLARFFAELAECEGADGIALVVGCAALLTTFAAQRCCGVKASLPRADEVVRAAQQSFEPTISVRLIARNLTINVNGAPLADPKVSLNSPRSVDESSSPEASTPISEDAIESTGSESLYRLSDGIVSKGSSPLGLSLGLDFLGGAGRSELSERRLQRFDESDGDLLDNFSPVTSP